MNNYIEDKNILVSSYKKRNYEEVGEIIDKVKIDFDYNDNYNETEFGYKINHIKSLSDLYGEKFYSVSFYLKKYNNTCLHRFENMFINLKKKIDGLQGYYIIKIPCEFEEVLNAYNNIFTTSIFTGGTVCYYYEKEMKSLQDLEDELSIKKINKDEAIIYKENLMELSKESFTNYKGQYHISEYTKDKAAIIYEKWVEEYIENMKDTIYVALLEGNIVGFLTVEEFNGVNEMVLSAVDEKVRGRRIYERMIRRCVEDSLEDEKLVTLSTQFNNYLVQRAWINIGFKPFHSFYTMHINNIK